MSPDIYHVWGTDWMVHVSIVQPRMKRLATLQFFVLSSCQHTAALFAFIELCRKSQVSPFGGWSSASFTDIRVCLCGWVMELLCWYVLLWWLQRPVTVTGKLPRNCHTATSLFQKDFQEVALYTANTLISQQPHVLPNYKPDNPSGPRGSSTESNQKPWTQTWGFQRDLEYVFLALVHSVYIFLE